MAMGSLECMYPKDAHCNTASIDVTYACFSGRVGLCSIQYLAADVVRSHRSQSKMHCNGQYHTNSCPSSALFTCYQEKS